MMRAVLWLALSICAALGGAAALVWAAVQLGRLTYADEAVSLLTLAAPLVAGVALDTVSVAAGGTAGLILSHRLRQRSFDNILAVDADRAELLGTGRIFALALDAELIGSFLVTTAPAVVLGLTEMLVGAFISANAPDGLLRVAVLVAGCLLLTLTGARLAHARAAWTTGREELSAEMVERLVGQRTVALQELVAPPDRLPQYARDSQRLDNAAIMVSAVAVGTGGLLVIMGLLLAETSSAVDVAVALGAAVLVTAGISRLSRVVSDLAGVWVAARQVRRLADLKAEHVEHLVSEQTTVLSATGLIAGYQAPLVGPLDIQVTDRDRLLVTGPSGSGKTTLMEVLEGRRAPLAGAVRRRTDSSVVRVPQAGDDHLLHGSLMFNVLMGHAWPPTDDDVDRLTAVLDDLGLTPVVERMPSGILQPLGDGGWRLSAGESARVRLARALVRRPSLLILDETFAALDAATFNLALQAAQKWAQAVIVVAHP